MDVLNVGARLLQRFESLNEFDEKSLQDHLKKKWTLRRRGYCGCYPSQ